MSIAARRSHRGDEYQIAVAVHWLIRLLFDSNIVFVQVEAVSLPSMTDTVDVDDIVVGYANGTTRHVQAKKNQKNHRSWQISDTSLKDELVKAHHQLQKTHGAIIEFCSYTPFGDLAALIESTRDYGTHDVFEAQATSNLKKAFAKLQQVLGSGVGTAFNLLRHIEIGDALSHAGWEASNRAALEARLDDAETGRDVIERLARRNQDGLRLPPSALTREVIVQALRERNVRLVRDHIRLDADQISGAFAAASADLAAWKTTLPNDDWLERSELGILQQRIADESTSVTLVLGEPGSGKSALLARLTREHIALGITVLAIKADYLTEDVVDTATLGKHLHLPADPLDCVATLAKQAKVLLIVDQLDALADLVVQHSSRLRGPIDLIRALSELQNVHIVASCRVFEHRHDTRLRNLEAETMTLDLPSWEKVEESLKKCDIHAGGWNASIREDLRSPQTLNLFLQLVSTTHEADLLLGYQHMLGELWKQQVLSDASGRSREALFKITTFMAEREMLWMPEALFDAYHDEVQRLCRSGILICNSGRMGFRHQTLYEYIRARSFLEEPGQLTDAVLSRQDSLRVRPLLWHSLAYMRAVDPSAYLREIEKLWHAELRPHLKMLLIEFLGQLQEPNSNEVALVTQRWGDPWYRNRFLSTIPGSQGWFDRIAGYLLPEVMQLPVEQARMALPVLCSAMPSRQQQVLELVRDHWQSIAEKDGLTWFVLEQMQAWDVQCIAQCRQILGRTRLPSWQVNQMVGVVSAALPDQAPLLVNAWLQLETACAQQPTAEDPDRMAALLNGQDFYDLPAIAEAAPLAFLETIWPWALKAIQLHSREAHDFLVRYCSTDAELFDIEDGDVRREKPFIASIATAIKTLAEQTPDKFLNFLQSNRHMDLMPVQQLLAKGLAETVATYPAESLEFLVEDPRRLVLGNYRDVHADSKRLISAVSLHLNDQQIHRLEQVIRHWSPYAFVPDDDPNTRLRRLRWTREHRLRLLRAIPEERMSDACKTFVAEEERAFPGLGDADLRVPEFREISSPMGASSMQRATDDQILNLFAELTDETQWDHPRDRMRGGVIQASRELAEFAKTSPERAINLIRRMEPGRNEIAVGSVVRALGESNYDANGLYLLIAELYRKGYANSDFRTDAAYAMGSALSSDTPLPQELFDLLSSWLADDPDPEPAPPEDENESKEPAGSILWSLGGFAVVPHGNYQILSTITQACLCVEPPQADTWLQILEKHLARTERTAVWIAMTHDLRYLPYGGRQRAQSFLIAMADAFPHVLHSLPGIRLLAHSQHWTSTDVCIDFLRQLFVAGTEFACQAAGELLLFRFAVHGGDEPRIVELLEQCLEDVHKDSFAQARVGIAYTAAEIWREAQARKHIHPYLLRLLGLGEDKVLNAASRVFARRELAPDAASRELLEFVRTRPEVLRLIGDDDFGECLTSMIEVEPGLVADVSRSLLDAIGDDFFNRSTPRYFLTENLLTISLRLQEMGTPHQEPGAYIFERILEFNTAEARSVVFDLDKRTTNLSNATPARRRRRRK